MASLTVRELVTKLGFQADMKGAKKFEDGLKKVNKAANVVVGAMASAGLAVVGLVKKTVDSANHIGTVANQAGTTALEYQGMAKWARETGTSVSTLDRALGRAQQRLQAAREGNVKYTEALQQMGYSQEQIESGTLTTATVMKRLNGMMRSGELNAEGYSAAVKFLGQNTARGLKPAFEDTSSAISLATRELEKNGRYLTEEQIARAGAFTKKWEELKEAFGFVATELGNKLLPVMEELLDNVMDWVEEHGDAFVKGITELANKINELVEDFGGWGKALKVFIGIFAGLKVLTVLATLTSTIGTLIGAFGTLAGVLGVALKASIAFVMSNPILLAIAAIIAAVVLLVKNWDWVKEKFQAGVEWVRESLGKLKDTFLGVWDSIKDGAKTAFDSIFGFYSGLWKKIYDTAASMGGKIKDFFIGLIPDWALKVAGKVGGAVGQIAKDITGRGATASSPNRVVQDVKNTNRSNTSTQNVNAKFESTIQVPPGTTKEQERHLKSTVDRMFDEKFSKMVTGAMVDHPVTE